MNTRTGAPVADLLLRFLLMARTRERARARRLLFPHEPLLGAGVEQVVEAAVARVKVTSQHEEQDRERVEEPASRRHGVTFYEEAQPVRPRPYDFREEVQRFPLGPTLRVFTCPTCSGSGKVTCGGCGGTGRISCSGCGGRGSTSGGSCGRCRGAGRVEHGTCGGRGQVTDRRCRGEGELATWMVQVHTFRVHRAGEEHQPVAPAQGGVSRAVDRWLQAHDEAVPRLEAATAAAHLGYETPQATAVVEAAEAGRLRLEAAARDRRGTLLFLRAESVVVPSGHAVCRVRGRPRWFWLVGRGAAAEEVAPTQAPGLPHVAAWLLAVACVALVLDALARGVGLDLPALSASWSDLALVPPAVLGVTSGAVLAGLLGLGVHATRPLPPVRAVALFPGDGPGSYLTLLGAVGSHLRAFDVVDRMFGDQVRALLGQVGPGRQSRSMALRLPDGGTLHLVEVADPAGMDDAHLSLLLRAVDGIVLLEGKCPIPADLRGRIDALLPGDRDLPVIRVGPELALEDLRHAWVRPSECPRDWPVAFHALWAPIGGVLGRPSPLPVPKTPAESP